MLVRFLAAALLVLAALGPASAGDSWSQSGHASWYGPGFQGKCVAHWPGKCVKFDTNKLTAAHRTLPFGTCLKVTSQNSGKSTFVRINDRGPFAQTHKRVIDLSKAAMSAIGGMQAGEVAVALVKVDKSNCIH